MALVRPGTLIEVGFTGTDIPGYLFGMIVPAHSTVAGYIQSALMSSGHFQSVVAQVGSYSVTVTVALKSQVDSSALFNLVRNAVANNYVDLSKATPTYRMVGAMPAPQQGGFVNEFTGQIFDNTGALVGTGLQSAFQGVGNFFGGVFGPYTGLIVVGGGALLLLALLKRE